MTAGSSFRLNDLCMEMASGCFPAVLESRSWTLKIIVHAGAPLMDGSSDEVLLCIPDESSGSPDRIYVAAEEQPL